MKQVGLLLFIINVVIFSNVNGRSVDVNSASYSPLHWAASQGYVEMIKVLVEKGYDINLQDASGFTPLHYAVASGSFEGVEYLVTQGADVYLVNNKNITPMTLAAQAGEQKIVDYLFIKMRSTKIDQLKAQTEKERVSTDLAKAAKARVEAERLRQQAADWTKEAEYWRMEAEKWTKEANQLKEVQIQIDQLAKERYEQILQEKLSAESNYNTERFARTAAERLLQEQSASTKAQIKAYEAQVAALAAQRATDAAIDNLANEFMKRGISPQNYTETNKVNSIIPIDVINQIPIPESTYSLELGIVPELGSQRAIVPNTTAPVVETADYTEEEYSADYTEEDVAEYIEEDQNVETTYDTTSEAIEYEYEEIIEETSTVPTDEANVEYEYYDYE